MARSGEGYLIITNGDGPPVPRELIRPGMPFVEGKELEMKAYRCGHCQTVIAAPARTLVAKCTYCDHKVCDLCAAAVYATGLCTCVEKRVDVIGEALVKGQPLEGLPRL
jgi:DNA-directed RNA polymerase subunit RPC12/RpoP